MTWTEYINIAFVGFTLGFSLGLLTLMVHLVRKSLGVFQKSLGGGSLL